MLEDILKMLGSKRPFRKKPKKYIDCDGCTTEDFLTKSGWKAYNKLIYIVYQLGDIGIGIDGDDVVDCLDAIVDSNEY